jgi:hypothetical protein
MLEHLQTLTPQPLRNHFRFIAGTSIGALIGAALAAGVAPKRIREEIERLGPELFARGAFHGLRHYLRAPYRQDLLSSALTRLFSEVEPHNLLDLPLCEQPLAVVITATSVSRHLPRIYGGQRLAFDVDSEITLREALLASSAAPTYFPAQKVRNDVLVDGGLVANAPDGIALALLQRKFGADLTDCHLLSVGTCAPLVSRRMGARVGWGKLDWIWRRPNIVDLTLDAQEKLTIQILTEILGERFVRLDCAPAGEDGKAVSTLDRAALETTEALKAMADREFERVRRRAEVVGFVGG